MYYGAMKKRDVANGPGVRVSLFVSGCTNRCEGCFQPETWNFCYGQEYTEETENEILKALSPSFIQGLSILGGEPFELENQEKVAELVKRVKRELPDKDIWCYSGFLFDRDLQEGGRRFGAYTEDILSCLDVLVDGKFEIEKKNISLAFRGSENQRVIDVPESRKKGRIILKME